MEPWMAYDKALRKVVAKAFLNLAEDISDPHINGILKSRAEEVREEGFEGQVWFETCYRTRDVLTMEIEYLNKNHQQTSPDDLVDMLFMEVHDAIMNVIPTHMIIDALMTADIFYDNVLAAGWDEFVKVIPAIIEEEGAEIDSIWKELNKNV